MQKAAEEAALDKQAEKEAAVQKGAKEALITQLPKLVQPLFEHKSLKALKDVQDSLSQGHVQGKAGQDKQTLAVRAAIKNNAEQWRQREAEAAAERERQREAAVKRGEQDAAVGRVFSVIGESLECEGKLCCQDSTFVMLTGCLQHACALHLYENPR